MSHIDSKNRDINLLLLQQQLQVLRDFKLLQDNDLFNAIYIVPIVRKM